MGLLTLPDRRIRQTLPAAPLQAPWVRALHIGRDTLTGFAPRIGAKAANRYGLGNKVVMSDTAEQVDIRIPTTPKFSMLLVGTFDAYTLDYPYFMQPNPAGSGLTLRHEGTGNRAIFYDGPTSTAVDSGLLFPLGDQFVLGLTYDGTKYRWYKNGADGNTVTAAFNPSGNWFYVSLTGKGNTHTSVLHAFADAALPAAKMRELTVNPWGVFAPASRLSGVPSAASITLTCSVGNANATGITALISRSIPCAVGNANASGVTASIATGSSTTITCSVGNASASGVATLVSLSITAAVGNANASGVTALITSGATTITCSVGNANASGVSALILGGAVTIPCTVGDAQATGVPSMVVFKTPTPAKPPGSGATGSGSNVRAVLPKWPTVGPVVDANGKMAQPWLHWFGGMYDRLVDTYSHQTPTDGAYLSVADGVSTLILDPAGPLASVAVRLPSTARDGMHLRITSTQTITLLYLWPADGQSLNSSPPTLAADTQIEFIFRMENRTWYRLQ